MSSLALQLQAEGDFPLAFCEQAVAASDGTMDGALAWVMDNMDKCDWGDNGDLFGDEEADQETTTVSLSFARPDSEEDLELRFYSSVDAGGFGELGDGGLEDYANLWSKRGDRGSSGLTIWAASVILGRWALAQPPEMLAGKRGLELGSGLGVAGIVVATRCEGMVLSDSVPEVVQKLRENVELNHMQARCDVERIDWSEGTGDQLYDLILASDVMYEPEAMPSLAAFVAQALSPKGLFIAISADTRAGLSVFQAEIAKSEAVMRAEVQPVPQEHLMDRGGSGDTFVLLTVRRAAA